MVCRARWVRTSGAGMPRSSGDAPARKPAGRSRSMSSGTSAMATPAASSRSGSGCGASASCRMYSRSCQVSGCRRTIWLRAGIWGLGLWSRSGCAASLCSIYSRSCQAAASSLWARSQGKHTCYVRGKGQGQNSGLGLGFWSETDVSAVCYRTTVHWVGSWGPLQGSIRSIPHSLLYIAENPRIQASHCVEHFKNATD